MARSERPSDPLGRGEHGWSVRYLRVRIEVSGRAGGQGKDGERVSIERKGCR